MQVVESDISSTILEYSPHAAIVVEAVVKVLVPNVFEPKTSEGFSLELFKRNVRFKFIWARPFTLGGRERSLG